MSLESLSQFFLGDFKGPGSKENLGFEFKQPSRTDSTDFKLFFGTQTNFAIDFQNDVSFGSDLEVEKLDLDRFLGEIPLLINMRTEENPQVKANTPVMVQKQEPVPVMEQSKLELKSEPEVVIEKKRKRKSPKSEEELEQRKMKRKEMNRIAAQKTRDRKKQHIFDLEDKVNVLKFEKKNIDSEIEKLEEEGKQLKSEFDLCFSMCATYLLHQKDKRNSLTIGTEATNSHSSVKFKV